MALQQDLFGGLSFRHGTGPKRGASSTAYKARCMFTACLTKLWSTNLRHTWRMTVVSLTLILSTPPAALCLSLSLSLSNCLPPLSRSQAAVREGRVRTPTSSLALAASSAKPDRRSPATTLMLCNAVPGAKRSTVVVVIRAGVVSRATTRVTRSFHVPLSISRLRGRLKRQRHAPPRPPRGKHVGFMPQAARRTRVVCSTVFLGVPYETYERYTMIDPRY